MTWLPWYAVYALGVVTGLAAVVVILGAYLILAECACDDIPTEEQP